MLKQNWAAIVVMFFLAGCAGNAIRPISDEDNAFIYGSVLLPAGAPEFVMVVRNFNSRRSPYVDPSGAFFIEDLEIDKTWYLGGFGYSGWGPSTFYEWPDDVKARTLPLKAGSMLYIGSKRVTEITPGWGGHWTYDIKDEAKPTRVEILKKLLENPKLEGTGWDERIRREIKRLSK
jgi:hypothetical protein